MILASLYGLYALSWKVDVAAMLSIMAGNLGSVGRTLSLAGTNLLVAR